LGRDEHLETALKATRDELDEVRRDRDSLISKLQTAESRLSETHQELKKKDNEIKDLWDALLEPRNTLSTSSVPPQTLSSKHEAVARQIFRDSLATLLPRLSLSGDGVELIERLENVRRMMSKLLKLDRKEELHLKAINGFPGIREVDAHIPLNGGGRGRGRIYVKELWEEYRGAGRDLFVHIARKEDDKSQQLELKRLANKQKPNEEDFWSDSRRTGRSRFKPSSERGRLWIIFSVHCCSYRTTLHLQDGRCATDNFCPSHNTQRCFRC